MTVTSPSPSPIANFPSLKLKQLLAHACCFEMDQTGSSSLLISLFPSFPCLLAAFLTSLPLFLPNLPPFLPSFLSFLPVGKQVQARDFLFF